MLLAVYLFDTRADHHHQKYKIKTVFCASDAQKTVFILYFFKCFKNAISYKNKCKELPQEQTFTNIKVAMIVMCVYP